MKKCLLFLSTLSLTLSCTNAVQRQCWTPEETVLIQQDSSQMRVLQITDRNDAPVLRKLSADIPVELLKDTLWQRLAARMLETVENGSNPGVGIAGPQVGVSRRVVAVQRFDKEGEPFEIYPNIYIIAARGERSVGPEGCLSVPNCRGDVLRWRDIDIKYTSLKTLRDTVESVAGFTAVIFQHECDHLEGLVYTDRIEAQNDPERIADDVRICLNRENGQYAVGETVIVTAGQLGVYSGSLEMTEFAFGKRGETKVIGPIGFRDTVYSATFAEPAAVMLEFRAEGQTPVDIPKDVNLDEDSFRIGFVVGAADFRPGNPRPADVTDFWDAEIAAMRQLPMNPVVNPVILAAKDSLVECFDVELNAPDSVPVRGYYARPRGVEAGSCAIVINFHSAGVAGHWARSKVKDAVKYARKGAICFDFNALGMKNGQDEAYYHELEEGSLKGYSDSPLEDRETYFFKNMILRAVRGLDYACSDSLWNGRTVLLIGESQGGYQAAMLASLDDRVSDVIAKVPAGVGTGGSRVGRCNSWPEVLEDNDFSQYSLDNAPYFDAAVLLQGCRANFLVEVGLIDVTCPPAEVFSGFNTVAGKVRYFTCPYRPHHAAKVAPQYKQWWNTNINDVRKAAADSIVQN